MRRSVLAMRATDAEVQAMALKASQTLDAAYWRFCRMARAKPPTMAEPAAHHLLKVMLAEAKRRGIELDWTISVRS